MAAFFIPGVPGQAGMAEHEYGDMRREVEADLGLAPSARRILRLWARRGGIDCVTEVGLPDPLNGGSVMAIFDMGPRRPFVVWRAPELGTGKGVREELGCTAYSVIEFDS